jgi:DNA-binding transcriptional MerR regulator
MTIGRFAHASGLTIKALRFYDEKGLLEPPSVDQDTGYRRYSAGQLRRAAMIKVLRQMGMSLAQVREVVDNPDRAAEHLARFKGDLDIQRARQDSAMNAVWTLSDPTTGQFRYRPASRPRISGSARCCRWISRRSTRRRVRRTSRQPSYVWSRHFRSRTTPGGIVLDHDPCG